jgi:ABC-type Co2+ transport system permease subunit
MGFQWMLHWWAVFILMVKICQKNLIKKKKEKVKWFLVPSEKKILYFILGVVARNVKAWL